MEMCISKQCEHVYYHLKKCCIFHNWLLCNLDFSHAVLNVPAAFGAFHILTMVSNLSDNLHIKGVYIFDSINLSQLPIILTYSLYITLGK